MSKRKKRKEKETQRRGGMCGQKWWEKCVLKQKEKNKGFEVKKRLKKKKHQKGCI